MDTLIIPRNQQRAEAFDALVRQIDAVADRLNFPGERERDAFRARLTVPHERLMRGHYGLPRNVPGWTHPENYPVEG